MVVCCRLSPLQQDLYCRFLESTAARRVLARAEGNKRCASAGMVVWQRSTSTQMSQTAASIPTVNKVTHTFLYNLHSHSCLQGRRSGHAVRNHHLEAAVYPLNTSHVLKTYIVNLQGRRSRRAVSDHHPEEAVQPPQADL